LEIIKLMTFLRTWFGLKRLKIDKTRLVMNSSWFQRFSTGNVRLSMPTRSF